MRTSIVVTKLVLVIGIICNISCNNETIPEKVEIDSSQIRRNLRERVMSQVKQEEKTELLLDSLDFLFSYQWDSVIGKKILTRMTMPEDIYKDGTGYHLIFDEGTRPRLLMDITCTKEQADGIIAAEYKGDTWMYFSIIPKYIRKVNLQLVSYADYNGEEDATSHIELDKAIGDHIYKIKGELVNVITHKKPY